jgi:hypothetical protein
MPPYEQKLFTEYEVYAGARLSSINKLLIPRNRGEFTDLFSCENALQPVPSQRYSHMDIYRYFHPHHNPRLFSTPLRQQELSELEQASSELRKALERARLRTERGTPSRILPSHFDDLLKAVKFIESSLQTLCDAHEGDTIEILKELVAERRGLRGWETWARIVTEQLASEHLASEHLASEHLASEHLVINRHESMPDNSQGTNRSLTEATINQEMPSSPQTEDIFRTQSHDDNSGHEQTSTARIAIPAPDSHNEVRNQTPHIITTPPAKSLTAHLQQNRTHQSHDATRAIQPEENSPQQPS